MLAPDWVILIPRNLATVSRGDQRGRIPQPLIAVVWLHGCATDKNEHGDCTNRQVGHFRPFDGLRRFGSSPA